MKKRQIKKNIRKHVRLYGDEGNLILYTNEEYEEAVTARRKEVFRIANLGYKRIKNMGRILYFYPTPKRATQFLEEMSKRTRKQTVGSSHTIVQTLNDIKG